MQIITNPKELKLEKKSIGFVPTMGALHEGHISLIKTSQAQNDITIVSIFVNPTQFGPNEDFNTYPRPIENDIALLKKIGIDYLFLPTPETLYPNGTETTTIVTIPKLTQEYCGKSRPTHFQGVLSVVLRLFNIIRPTRAYFGEKDYQQLTLIQHMAQDLFLPVQIIGCPIIREKDGLALSSRNQYLTTKERAQAPTLYQALQRGQEVAYTLNDTDLIIETVKTHLPTSFKVDYIAITPQKNRLLIAATLGNTRLIDNIPLELKK